MMMILIQQLSTFEKWSPSLTCLSKSPKYTQHLMELSFFFPFHRKKPFKFLLKEKSFDNSTCIQTIGP